MNLTTFTSKINLPSVISKLGGDTNDYEFVRVPLFGWYAKHKTTGNIGNIFNFFEMAEWPKLYGTIHKNFSDCYEFKLPYSEYAEKKLFKAHMRLMQFQSAWVMSMDEAQKHTVREGGKTYYVRDFLDMQGMPALLDNGFGYLSERVVNEFPELDLITKARYRKVLVVPTFCTPKHICSIEVAKLQDITALEEVMVNCEKGWYGKYNVEILKDLNEMKIKPGCTWDAKLDNWNTNVVALSENLTAQQVIKIWSEVNKTHLATDPVQELVAKSGTDDIKNHVGQLTYPQIQELERKSGDSLLDYWVKSKEQQYDVHGHTYARRGTAYYRIRENREEQLSNFCLDIDVIKKVTTDGSDEFIWCGSILHQHEVIPFEMSDRFFTSSYLFSRGIRQQFMELGIGIPFLNERYIRELMTLIQLTCYNVKIVNT